MAERQSPVDIPATAPTHDDGLEIAYLPQSLAFADNDYAVQVDCPPGSSHASIEGHPFELLQFHIHCPSEHALAGRGAPASVSMTAALAGSVCDGAARAARPTPGTASDDATSAV